MKIETISLADQDHFTNATLTAYLQTPTPKSPWQEFPPLIIVPGGSMTHITTEESEKRQSKSYLFNYRFYLCEPILVNYR